MAIYRKTKKPHSLADKSRPQCEVDVSTPGLFHHNHRCQRYAVTQDTVTSGRGTDMEETWTMHVCRLHSQDEVKKRAQRSEKNWQARGRELRQMYGAKYRRALMKIAEGELNDPAGYAAMKLEEIDGE